MTGQQLGLPGRDLLFPKYAIHNTAAYTIEDNAGGGGISNHTVNTDLIHQNGLAMYDTHNLYGTSKLNLDFSSEISSESGIPKIRFLRRKIYYESWPLDLNFFPLVDNHLGVDSPDNQNVTDYQEIF